VYTGNVEAAEPGARFRARPRTRSSLGEIACIIGDDGLDLSQLPSSEGEITEEEDEPGKEDDRRVSVVTDNPEMERISTTCVCFEFDRGALQRLLSERSSRALKWKQDTLYVDFSPQLIPTTSSSLKQPLLRSDDNEGDVERCLIFFCFGVVVMWGLTPTEERDVLEQIVKDVSIRPMKKQFVEEDTLSVQYTTHSEKASIRNDILSIPRRLRNHRRARLSVAHALAQSTKLGVLEAQGLDLLQSNAHLPWELEERGHVSLSRKKLSKLIGRLFVHKSEVNLLSSVLDTPEYFWTVPDTLQELFKSVANYLEIDERIVAVNQRLEVLQEMFDMLQSRQDAQHGAVLEWIVIVLVALEFVVGVLEFCGTIGLIAPSRMSLAGRLARLWHGDAGQELS